MRKKRYTEEEVIALLEKQRESCAQHLGLMNLSCSYPEDFYTMYHWIRGTPLVLKLENPPKPDLNLKTHNLS